MILVQPQVRLFLFAGEVHRTEASVEECSEEVQEAAAEVPQLRGKPHTSAKCRVVD